MKFKQRLAYLVVLVFGMTLISNFVPAYAAGTSPFKISVTVNGNSGVQTVAPGSQVSIGVNVQRIGAVTKGQEIHIKIPSGLTNVNVDTANISKVFTVSQNGDELTLTANQNTVNMVNGYMSISGTLKNVDKNGNDSGIKIGNVTYPIKVENTQTPGGGDSSQSGGNIAPLSPWNFVNWGDGIDKNIGYQQQKIEQIGVLGSNNNTVTFTIGVNANEVTQNLPVTDTLPEGMTLVPGSISISGMNKQGSGENVVYTPYVVNNINIQQQGNKIIFSGFQKNYDQNGYVINTNHYLISYQCKLSESYFANKYKDKVTNSVAIPGHVSGASVIVNTANQFNPNDENGIISKTSNAKVFQNKGQIIQYTVNINPKFVNLKNVDVVDQLPEGLTLYPNVYNWQYQPTIMFFQKGGGNMTNYDINVVSPQGQVSTYISVQNPQATITYDLQNNQIRLQAKQMDNNVKIIYYATANGKSNNITNTVTIKNNGLSSSASATSQYFSNSGSLQAWKTVNGKEGTITTGDAQATYQIHLLSNGYYPDGYIDVKDPLQKGLVPIYSNGKLEYTVQQKQANGSYKDVPGVFSATITGNTIEFKNNKYVGNNEEYVINFKCSLANFKGGDKIYNTAYVNETPTNTVTINKEKTTVANGKISIVKKDAQSGAALEGATFNILNEKGNIVDTIITGSNGIATSKDLPLGTYTVQEKTAPNGYTLAKEQKVTIGEAGQTATVNFKDNEINGAIKVVKTNEAGKPLEGATFTITSGAKTYKATTNSEGVAEFTNLPWGTYKVQETVAPVGYTVNNAFNENTKDNTVTINESSFKGQTLKEPVFNVKDTKASGSLNITKTGADKKPLEGAEFTISNGQNTYKATTDANGVASFKDLPWGTYKVQEIVAPKGYTIKNNIPNVTIGSQENGTIVLNQKLTVNDSQIEGIVKIVKTDISTGAPLQGAKFNVLDSNGKVVATITTNNEGIAETGKLPFGEYTLQEVVAPNGYNKAVDQKVNITENDKTYTVNFKDSEINGAIKIVKTDANTGKALEGVVFTATSESKTYKATTNNEGVAEFANLPWGTYKVQEVSAPYGYNVNKAFNENVKDNTVTINGSSFKGQTLQEPVFNVKDTEVSGSLNITKTGVNGVPLQGAEFTISNGKDTFKGTTGTNGVASFKDLPWGTYTIKETVAPVGYSKKMDIPNVVIGTQKDNKIILNQNVTVSDSQVLGQLQITKTNEKETKDLEGATFTVKGPNGFSKKVTTDKNGVASLDGLHWGTYTVTETVAPKGYNLNTTPQTVDVTSTSVAKVQSLSFKDSATMGTVDISKVDVTNEKEVAGAKINISGTSLTGIKENITFTSGTTPTKFTLPAGTYTYTEIDAPNGYNINKTVGHFTIDKQGQIVKAVVKDSRIDGAIKVVKTDANTGKPLEGVVFTATSEGKTYKATTNNEGVAEFANLPWGTYKVQEVSAPYGYNVNKAFNENVKDNTVTINGSSFKGQTLQEPVFNVKDTEVLGSLNITKTGNDGKLLEGATFTITNGKDSYKATTGKDGVASFKDLPWGTYTVKETVAPKGYNKAENIENVTIGGPKVGEIVLNKAITVKDSPTMGTVDISKVDATNEKEVAGAKINISGTSLTGIKENITFTSGTTPTKFTLPAGTYTYTEIDAPNGYNINKTVGHFTIDKQGQIVKAVVKDSRIDGAIKVVKIDANTGKPLEGVVFTATSGNNNYKATTNSKGIAEFTNLPWGTYKVQEVSAPYGYNVDKAFNENAKVNTVTINGSSFKGEILQEPVMNVKDTEIPGSLNITKTGNDGKLLEGATFTITNGKDSYKATTGKDGVASFKDLPWGTYTVKETVAPKGYNKTENIENVTIGGPKVGEIVLNKAITVKDSPTMGTLDISKVDATNEKEVAGARINISGTSLTGIKENITFTSGTTPTKFTLPAGTYTYTEVDAPKGYNINKTVGHFTIDKQGQIVKAVVKDTPTMGTLDISKVDVTNEQEVAGAKINISGTSLTGKKININFTSGTTPTKFTLPAGTYTYTEIDAPVGYKINKTVGHFTIDAQGQIVKAVVKDQRIDGQIQIVKTNENGSKKLEGATFNVAGPNGFNKTVTTNNEGVINLSNLAWGKYTIKEVSAPKGYNLNTTPQVINVTNETVGRVQEDVVKDTQIMGTIKVIKENKSGSRLQGATFNIVNGKTGAIVETITTGKDGIAMSEALPYGEYLVKEISAPKGYMINGTWNAINIAKNGQIYSLIVKDELIPQKPISNTNINGTASTNVNSASKGAIGTEGRGTNPKTGDSSNMPMAILLLTALIGLVGVNRKKIMKS